MLPTEQDPAAYAQWTIGMWDGQDHVLAERDLGIMGLGLGGEMGELALAALAAGPAACTSPEVAKELGDVAYYWACLAPAFGRCLRTELARACPTWSDPALPLDSLVPAGSFLPSTQECLLALAGELGLVQEQLKKRTRDARFDADAFGRALGRAGLSWCRAVRAVGLVPSQVLRRNIDKLESRRARGTLGGSGDDR